MTREPQSMTREPLRITPEPQNFTLEALSMTRHPQRINGHPLSMPREALNIEYPCSEHQTLCSGDETPSFPHGLPCSGNGAPHPFGGWRASLVASLNQISRQGCVRSDKTREFLSFSRILPGPMTRRVGPR
jgi:hypothetical protein